MVLKKFFFFTDYTEILFVFCNSRNYDERQQLNNNGIDHTVAYDFGNDLK